MELEIIFFLTTSVNKIWSALLGLLDFKLLLLLFIFDWLCHYNSFVTAVDSPLNK